ncbi:MAG TPA: sulfatase-like hydrolase/transferase [Gaiellaceae bacterium]|nr:sulfatase-like hydrolase/transferase [Gaiellaceae bacterium]
MSAIGERVGAASRPRAARRAPPAFPVRALHLFVLSAFALAQPLFAVLSESPEFFVVRGSTRWDLVVFALGLVVVPPALLLGIEALVHLARPRAAAALHLVFVGALVTVVALQTMKRLGDGPAVTLVAGAALVGAGAAVAYARAGAARAMLTLLSPAPLIFAGFFLLESPVSKVVLSGEESASAAASPASGPPIVWVVLDELPVASLMDERGRIDGVRFPNFAALASDATWFRNATTVHEHTTESVPAMLTGNFPREQALPFAADHPVNLFTLLAPTYRYRVFETATRLCPQRLCPRNEGSFASRMSWLGEDVSWVYLHVLLPNDLTRGLPVVTQTWGNFGGRAGEDLDETSRFDRDIDHLVGRELAKDQTLAFDAMVDALERGTTPTVYFAHPMLPHSPWFLLPNGRGYANGSVIRGLRRDTWGDDEWLVTQEWQRHLLQAAAVDRMLGDLLRRLRALDLYEDALVVLTADHGVSFRPGERRRGATVENLADIAFVPMIVKAPGQRTGRIVDEHVRTVDLLPTVTDLLGVELSERVDGRSALAPDYESSPIVRVFRRGGEAPVEADFAELVRERDGTVARQADLFETGTRGNLFRIGPNLHLLGRHVDELGVRARPGARVAFDEPRLFEAVDPSAQLAPSHLSGDLGGDLPGDGHLDLAIAVNGRIAAVTRSFGRRGRLRFAAIVPDDAFRVGANEVEVFAVARGANRVALERLGR